MTPIILLSKLLRRFPEAEVEALYRDNERSVRAGSIRTLSNIGLVCMSMLIIMNSVFLPGETVARYNLFAVPLVIGFLVFGRLTLTEIYRRQPWIDAVSFTIFVGLVYGIITVLATQKDRLQWNLFALITVNAMTMVSFASFAFLASFRWYLVWTLVLSLAVYVGLSRTGASSGATYYSLATFLILAALSLFCNWAIDARSREVFWLTRRLEAERRKSETLLYNVLPQQVAERLREGGDVADAFSDATVVFVDIVGFSGLARTLSPGHLVDMLNAFFGLCDGCAQHHGVEKVKTIGDAYLAISGTITHSPAPALAAVRFGKTVVERTAELAAATGLDLKVRVGVHTGPVIGGVIGSTRMSYDYWGDTVIIASRLQGAAEPNSLCVSEATFFRTRGEEAYGRPRPVLLKGIGESQVYDLAPLATAA